MILLMLLWSISCDCQAVSHTWLPVSCKQCFAFVSSFDFHEKRWSFVLYYETKGNTVFVKTTISSNEQQHMLQIFLTSVLYAVEFNFPYCTYGGHSLYFQYLAHRFDLWCISTDIDSTTAPNTNHYSSGFAVVNWIILRVSNILLPSNTFSWQFEQL